MTITKTTEFNEADRYLYDQLLFKQGFATLDSASDASYYGQWASPSKQVLFSYVEGTVAQQSARPMQSLLQRS